MSKAEWLDRPEPIRVPVDEFGFKLRVTKTELRGMKTSSYGGDCLANQIATSGNISSGATSYGEECIKDDGTAEQLLGCRLCGAMCTVTYSASLGSAVHENAPRTPLNVAEAPQPNPWMELGTFDDCKAGKVKVPIEASALTEPVNLTEDQRQIIKILTGHVD
jgi:hypothetical protein